MGKAAPQLCGVLMLPAEIEVESHPFPVGRTIRRMKRSLLQGLLGRSDDVFEHLDHGCIDRNTSDNHPIKGDIRQCPDSSLGSN